MSDKNISFLAALWLVFIVPLRVLLDRAFATRVWAVRGGMPALPPADDDEDEADDEAPPSSAPSAGPDPGEVRPLQLLALLQREGRLIDFLQQDITDFDDTDVGAAARVVHEGCRKALLEHARIKPVRSEEEDDEVEVEKGYDPAAIKLMGDIKGKAPYSGVLRHRGWRVERLDLPEALEGHDFRVVAPAEVEL